MLLAAALGCGGGGGDTSKGADGGASEGADAGRSPADAAPESVARAVVAETGGVGLNLRAGPGTDEEALAVMPDHEVLVVRGDAEGPWWPVHYRGTEGWAHESFLEVYLTGEVPELSAGFNFLLPWQDGDSFPVTQGHNGGSHVGINAWAWDFGMPEGTPVHASHAGVVRSIRADSSGGGCDPAFVEEANYVTLDRGDGLETTYVHLQSVAVAQGQRVERGALLGTSGETGYACGAHLHFQIQLSPDGGGGTSGANQSVHAYFWDTLAPEDPPVQTQPVSANGSADVP